MLVNDLDLVVEVTPLLFEGPLARLRTEHHLVPRARKATAVYYGNGQV